MLIEPSNHITKRTLITGLWQIQLLYNRNQVPKSSLHCSINYQTERSASSASSPPSKINLNYQPTMPDRIVILRAENELLEEALRQRNDELARIRQDQIETAARTVAKLQELHDLREMVRLAREANQ